MKRNWALTPYLIWMIIFIVVPLALVVYYGITVNTDSGVAFSLSNFKRFAEPIYLRVLWRSIKLAIISTIICLIIGYPVAMILAGNSFKHKNVMVMLLVVPMWMNFLLRTYAWLTLLEKNGIINSILGKFGLPMLNILYTESAVILGMVYNFLPFMILPIYSVMSKMDYSLIEAAEDLGAGKMKVFTKIIFPLSIPGIITGITMVFMPAVSTFVISRLLGGGQYMLIGNLIEQQFLGTGDWHFGSAISIIMMIIILITMAITAKFDEDNEGGGGLW